MTIHCNWPANSALDLCSDAFINGASSSSKYRFHVENPKTHDCLAMVTDAQPEQWEAAVAGADLAQQAWAKSLPQEKSECLSRWSTSLLAVKEDMAYLITLETGKPYYEAMAEVIYSADYLTFYAAEALRIKGELLVGQQISHKIVLAKEPVGVVAAITPWNFPLAMLSRKAAPAIAAGCSIVCKPAPQTPLTAIAMAQLAAEAGLPAGLLQVLPASAVNTPVLGRFLCADTRVKKMTFTGSTAVGKQLMAAAAPTLKRLSLELGGNAPVLVLEDADIELAAKGVVAAKFRNAGQTCICVNRVLVAATIFDEFLAAVMAKIKLLTLGPLIDGAAVDRVRGLLQKGELAGARLVPVECTTDEVQSLYYVSPVIALDVHPANPLFNSEIFGPVLSFTCIHSTEEAISLANQTLAGLAAYVYCKDTAKGWLIAERLHYGMVGVNTTAISNASAPFGGVKESGFGREGGAQGLEEYLQLKTMSFNFG